MLSLIVTYKYWFVFFGTMVGGEFVIVPVIYLASVGGFDITYTILTVVAGSFVADSFWYFAGKHLPLEKFGSLPFLRHKTEFKDDVKRFFKENGLWAVFFSKFVYGTRTVTQIMAGIYKLGYLKYVLFGMSGVAVWSGALFALAYFLNLGLDTLKETATSIQVSFLVFIVILVIIHIGARKLFEKKVKE